MHEEETKSKTEADANEHHLETAVTSARPTVTSAVLLAGEAGKEKLTRTRHEAIQEGWGRDVARDKRARSAVRTTRAESRLAEERARVPTEAGESHAVTENMKMKDPVGVESCPESGASCAASVTEPAAENPQPAQLDYMELPQLLCLKDRTGIVLGDMLGGGSFGTVYEASLKGSQWPAWLLELDLVVKVVRDNASGNGGGGVSRGRVFDEFVLGSVRHPSLVSCLGFTQSSPFWALFERCDCGSLWKALKGSRRSEAKARLLEERVPLDQP
ncbi:Protein kinase-like domain containing protein [Klebsormidium nitens]|uniref:Protein kinase-like domain containing protein n=1 Tax=Klebsormidium nitens TaxID=105231 RepID=A0A1Y1I297_KLENI|nr:Protein kinase-like domain containing protein [Klebsormidium nitens]|eukprot:GAQ83559.1 Protein kinase-like domain containing protein [Klebsormidium nitens]